MHLEWRARQGKGHQRMVRIVQECLVWLLGVGLGLLVGDLRGLYMRTDTRTGKHKTSRRPETRQPPAAPSYDQWQ